VQSTTLAFWKNGEKEERSVGYITLDFADNSHVLGALVKDEIRTHYYRGFLYMFRLFQGAMTETRFESELMVNCGPCEVCPKKT
jgi:hypothetical protein